MLKILASHMLQGIFTIEKVTSLKLKANSVEPSAFLPQRNKVLVKQELLSKVKATSENVMDFANSHKTKGKTAIACISTMHSMVDFSSLCINMDTIITVICSNNEPQPILHQILLNFVTIVNDADWVRWSDNVGPVPSLHWYCYSFLKQIFNCFANFATDFGNGNIMSKACLCSRPDGQPQVVCVCGLSSGYSGSVLITRYQSLDLFRLMSFPPYPKPQ